MDFRGQRWNEGLFTDQPDQGSKLAEGGELECKHTKVTKCLNFARLQFLIQFSALPVTPATPAMLATATAATAPTATPHL